MAMRSMSDIECDADAFADVLNGMLKDSAGKVKKGATKAVREGGEKSRDEWSSLASGMFNGTGRYAASIEMKMHRSDDGPTSEVGSASLPGLPHLLEKGHALVGGGRSRAFPHVAPAAEAGFKVTEQALKEIEL